MTLPHALGQDTGYSLYERVYYDIYYHMVNTLYTSCFPHYQSYRPHNGYCEYTGLAKRLL